MTVYCPHCFEPIEAEARRCENLECGQPVTRTLELADALNLLRTMYIRYRRAVNRTMWLIGPVIGERLPQQGQAGKREMRETLEQVYDVCRNARNVT